MELSTVICSFKSLSVLTRVSAGSAKHGGKEIRKMLKGDSFGEQALYYNTVRQATVRALDNVEVYSNSINYLG